MYVPASVVFQLNEPGTMSIGFTVATESFFLYFSRSKIQILFRYVLRISRMCCKFSARKSCHYRPVLSERPLTSSASILHSKPYRPAMVSAMRLMLVFFQTCSLFFHESSSRLAGRPLQSSKHPGRPKSSDHQLPAFHNPKRFYPPARSSLSCRGSGAAQLLVWHPRIDPLVIHRVYLNRKAVTRIRTAIGVCEVFHIFADVA